MIVCTEKGKRIMRNLKKDAAAVALATGTIVGGTMPMVTSGIGAHKIPKVLSQVCGDDFDLISVGCTDLTDTHVIPIELQEIAAGHVQLIAVC